MTVKLLFLEIIRHFKPYYALVIDIKPCYNYQLSRIIYYYKIIIINYPTRIYKNKKNKNP